MALTGRQHLVQLAVLQAFRSPQGRKTHRMAKARYPKNAEQGYAATLLHLLEQYKGVLDELLRPQLESLVIQARGEKLDELRADAVGSRVAAIFEAIRRAFGPLFQSRELETLVDNSSHQVSNFERDELRAQVKAAIGVDVFGSEPDLSSRLEAFAKENVALIKSIPVQATDQLEQRILSQLQRGGRAEDLAQEIEERYGVAEDRAMLIARDQIGKLNGQLARVRQQSLGLSQYVWRTALDERVRPSHAELEGTVQDWADPPIVDGEPSNPGDPINCRCTADPNVDQVLEDLDQAEGE